ncbi:hypothetical protein FA13DRAFT_513893 [Coprinellus micaceus]|uniref:Uncharacterized protein n=1 Tax=Coprinellus micaceus TaxID=71717 RepID=A0A4Y7SBD3_COPMI|nr:hypothetical protein FA13DRAFT_513893 [Coprinellus micaceus]
MIPCCSAKRERVGAHKAQLGWDDPGVQRGVGSGRTAEAKRREVWALVWSSVDSVMPKGKKSWCCAHSVRLARSRRSVKFSAPPLPSGVRRCASGSAQTSGTRVGFVAGPCASNLDESTPARSNPVSSHSSVGDKKIASTADTKRSSTGTRDRFAGVR